MKKERSALLLLDLQNEMVDPHGKVGSGGLAVQVAERGVLVNAAKALAAFREKGLPVVHVRLGFRADYLDCMSVASRIAALKSNKAAILGEWGTEFAPQVAPEVNELVVTKQCVNPFFNSGLLTWLNNSDVRRVVLAGVATNLVVESSARYCDDAGLAVTVLEDCCASPNPEWHRFAADNILPIFGEVISTENFLAERL